MLLLLLSYLGGVLTIFSPCVLPVLPFLFSRADQPFRKTGLPTLIGMAASFAVLAALSVAGGAWVVQLNQVGRVVAMVVFAVLGLSLLFDKVAQRLMQPVVALGGLLQKRASRTSGVASSLLIGVSVGMLWAPCAGPILGLVLAGAALGGASPNTFALLAAFSLGAASSLAVGILASGKVLGVLKRGFGVEAWLKKGLGVAVLVAVAAIALGLDTKLLAKISYLNTNAIEQGLIGKLADDHQAQPAQPAMMAAAAPGAAPANEGVFPPLTGATTWLNSEPLTNTGLQGKVVLVDFWTYSCINCLRSLPYVQAWSERYKAQGLVVIGVHAPEFAFERVPENVAGAVKSLGLSYPIAVDSDLKIWTAFNNQYWPAHYLIDATGHIRFHHFGEGNYEETEHVIQELLGEAHPGVNQMTAPIAATVKGDGLQLAAGKMQEIATPETYLGYERQQGFASKPDIAKDAPEVYSQPAALNLNQWSLNGSWQVGAEMVKVAAPGSTLTLRFKARDLHLVLGNPDGKPLRIRVKLDGKTPDASHGVDIDATGSGVIASHRLYQLIRQDQSQGDHVFEVEFLDAGAEAFAFTFG